MTGEQLYTPTDEVSGLPLLIVPEARALSILRGEEPSLDEATGHVLGDWNHVYHPAKVVVSDGFGGDALRNARMQFVVRETHNSYHHAYYGPPLPLSPAGRFKATVLSAAGYIPMQAIQFEGDSPTIVDLAPPMRERLRTSGEVRVASLSVVQKFMKDFVLAQPVDHIRPNIIDDFLSIDPSSSIDDARRRRYLAHLLLSLVIDRVEDPLDGPYSFAYSSNLLKPGAPRRPGDFVHGMIARSASGVRTVTRELAKKLSIQREGPDVATRLGKLALVS